ncbi:MAG: hypothetical protein LBS45_05980 [Synergistaceae bacterium]|jgi:uncharacterized membrane protein YcgQ (UPF0703/DUF1980 family)|nr:hypothetical protein [Synergistaceae bacterium]
MKKIFLALLFLPILGGAFYMFFSGGAENPPDYYYADEIEDVSEWSEPDSPAVPETTEKESGPPPAAGPEPSRADRGAIVEIKDKFFIQQCNDIYLNPDEYVGRTVRLEGIYDEFKDDENGWTERFVIRYGPGCCGNDGVAGFEFLYDGPTAPKQDDWVEVTGTVDMKKGDDGEEYLVLASSKLRVMDKRGQEYVEN